MHLRNVTLRAAAVAGALWASTCQAAPTVDELAAVLWRYNDVAASALPIPSADELHRLASGQTVHVRERLVVPHGDQADRPSAARRLRVVGYQLVERPRLLVWLATLHAGTTHEKRLLEHRISVNDDRSSTWYQHLDTPWPIRNRHWVIRSGKNVELAAATQDLVWEHHWQLAPRGRDIALNLMLSERLAQFDRHDFERTIYLPENAGAWTMFALNDDTTLVVTHTTADMGGWIPERWVAGFVARQLEAVLRGLEARADTIHNHYDPADPVHSGRGEPITRAQLSTARSRFKPGRERAAGAGATTAPRRQAGAPP